MVNPGTTSKTPKLKINMRLNATRGIPFPEGKLIQGFYCTNIYLPIHIQFVRFLKPKNSTRSLNRNVLHYPRFQLRLENLHVETRWFQLSDDLGTNDLLCGSDFTFPVCLSAFVALTSPSWSMLVLNVSLSRIFLLTFSSGWNSV